MECWLRVLSRRVLKWRRECGAKYTQVLPTFLDALLLPHFADRAWADILATVINRTGHAFLADLRFNIPEKRFKSDHQNLHWQMNAVFLDRDGVINRRRIGDYVKQIEEFEFIPDIFDVLPAIHDAGFLAIVITNQRGIARGLMSDTDLEGIHAMMQAELMRRTGHGFDAIYFCPHNHQDACDCRKPLPGMLLQASTDHDIDLARSWMIGDSESDIEAGIAAGCRTIRVTEPGVETRAEFSKTSLAESWDIIGSNSASLSQS